MSIGGQVWLTNEDPKGPPSPSPGTGDHTSTRQASLRILIVEDEMLVALLLEDQLKNFDYAVERIVANGEDAVKFSLSHEVDLILMDVNLGAGIDGVEAARQIQTKKSIPIIFVTAYATQTILSRIRTVAPSAQVVSKPVSADHLQSVIRSLLSLP